MARRSKNTTSRGRDLSNYPRSLPVKVVPSVTPSWKPPARLVARLEDRRLFHPDLLPRRDTRPPAAVTRAAVTIVDRPRKPSRGHGASFAPGRLSFAAPDLVSICAKRKIRRNVLFAKGKTGGGNRHPKRNFWSRISCSAR